jgi:hypothetical protein
VCHGRRPRRPTRRPIANRGNGAGVADHVGDGIALRLQEHHQARPVFGVLAGQDVRLRHLQPAGITVRDDALDPGVAGGQGNVLVGFDGIDTGSSSLLT